MAMSISNCKQMLEKAELWMDEKTGECFFGLEYLCEDEAEVFRVIFPKVETGIPTDQFTLRFRRSLEDNPREKQCL